MIHKKKILLLIILLTNYVAFGQVQKGAFMLGSKFATGQFGIGKNAGGLNLFLTPNLGYFVSDHLVLGTSIPLQINKRIVYSNIIVGGQDTYLTTTSVAVEPFARYYFGHNKVHTFVGFSYFQPLSNSTFDANNIVYSGSLTNNSKAYNISFGFASSLNQHITFDTILNYSKSSNSTYSILSLSFAFQGYFFKNAQKQ